MVSTLLGLIILALAMNTVLANQQLYHLDTKRVRLNQNMRGALDFIGAEVRQAGERLPANFPAIELIDGGGDEPDELILRKSVIDEVLTLCAPVAAASTPGQLMLSDAGAGVSPACVYGGQAQALEAFEAYRTAEGGGNIKAYIFDFSTQLGEYFEYSSEDDSGVAMSLDTDGKVFENAYTAENTAIYLLSDWHFLKSAVSGEDLLQLIIDLDEENPQNVMYGVETFSVEIIMSDDSVVQEFGAGDDWSQLKAVNVRVVGSESFKKQSIQTDLTSQFFPRNNLSL